VIIIYSNSKLRSCQYLTQGKDAKKKSYTIKKPLIMKRQSSLFLSTLQARVSAAAPANLHAWLIRPFAVFLLLVFMTGFAIPTADPLNTSERKFALDYFEKTKERFLADVKGLSESQLTFKADSSRWSIAQCIEHIALAESLLWQWGQGSMKQSATPDKRAEVKMTNEQVIQGLEDRSKKFKAPEFLQPTGKFPDSRAAIRAYVLRRDSTMAYIRSTQDDLKNHFVVHPLMGTIDDYQVLLLLASHSARHTLQIEEVKASPGYPKN
jgi:hypothetical protein